MSRTPPVPASQGPSNPPRAAFKPAGSCPSRPWRRSSTDIEHLRGARVEQLFAAETAGQHADRAHLGGLRGHAVPRRVADHHGVLGLRSGLLERREHEVRLGLGLLHVARVGPAVDERAGVEQRQVVLELLGLGATRPGSTAWPARLQVLDQRARARERLDLADQLQVEDLLGRAHVVAVLAVEALAGEGGDELVAAHPDVPVDAPQRQDEAVRPERAVPGDRVVVVGVHQRAVDVHHRRGHGLCASAPARGACPRRTPRRSSRRTPAGRPGCARS